MKCASRLILSLRRSVQTSRGTFATLSAPEGASFSYAPLFQKGDNGVLDSEVIEWIKHEELSQKIKLDKATNALVIPDSVLSKISELAFVQANHFYRKSHLQSLYRILEDPEASENDKFVARELLKNAEIAARGDLPSCQDTGTATVVAKRGYDIRVTHDMTVANGTRKFTSDDEALSHGAYRAYNIDNLRYSQLAPTSMWKEINTRNNLPAQIDLNAVPGNKYELLFIAKGGGSSNKTQLYQKNKAVLNEKSFKKFLKQELVNIGTAACPPYHLAVVIGGLSPEMTIKTVKLAACKYYDHLPITGDEKTGRAFRDNAMENEIREMCRDLGIGAQFGGKYFVHDVRVIRLPRHGGSCPIAVSMSCSADRQVNVKINSEGVYFEKLVEEPENVMVNDAGTADPVELNIDLPIEEVLSVLSKHPIKTPVKLSGHMVVARDIAHANILQKLKAEGKLPDYMKKMPIYYAGPAKTPTKNVLDRYRMSSSSNGSIPEEASTHSFPPVGSFGPTSSTRFDLYVEPFLQAGGSKIMIGKGNRAPEVAEACKKYGGFYLGSPGGIASVLSAECIKSNEVLDMPELGMEAVYLIRVEDFPAFILVDDKGNDFFTEFRT